ncbi:MULTISPECIES: dihydroorotase [Shewanella]|uniref:dihydroorotase n=1 Tax=Shewanella TaxID=22 RepID=UPI000ECF9929|nr:MULTISPECIES: dihydroorotase [Shewanella]MCA0949643.1 dihydroorotase [Shewanella chilikensis]MCE9851891.1 dihydroorotase [Shewanella chilikensis]HCD14679.1 dihydroorotase [Shewanella sp.]
MKTLICNAQLVNEGTIRTQDLLIDNGRISQIAPQITAPAGAQVIDAQGKHLLPGMIDDQVHFREPGFPNKGTIASESRAAVAGGITSFMEMPNVNPQTTNLQALEDKYTRASQSSLANFAFYLGATNDNLEEIKRLDPNQACGVKIFMGASTGNMLVDNSATLDGIFANSPVVIATHCEDSPTIAANEAAMREKYGDAIPMELHGEIRSREACLKSSQLATELAIRHKARLHVLHLTTADELYLFEPAKQLAQLKGANITAEVCVHHLSFNDSDYARLGSQIKCNPAIKTLADQQALIDAVNRDIIDIIATDHAPHTWEEKQADSYFKAPSGLPLVQHALLGLLDLHAKGHFSLEKIVQKTSHAVAERFELKDRGYLREGYLADLVLVDLNKPFEATLENTRYHCGWSPFTGHKFAASISGTWVNGKQLFDGSRFIDNTLGQRLTFNRT